MRGLAVVGVAAVALVGAAGAGWSMIGTADLRVVPPVAGAETAAPAPPASTPTLVSPTTAAPPPAGPPSAAPPCAVGDEPAPGDPTTDWSTILIDAGHALPADYVPPDLVEVRAAGFRTDDRIRQIVVDDLAALRLAAQQNDTPLVIISAYRSYEYQEGLFQSAVDDVGPEEAQRTTARPGHSEHQLGTSLDVLDPDTSSLTPAFGQTPTGQWLAANAHLYGFVASYPDVAPERTCYGFEPWHLRYVGRDTAAAVQASGLSLREWLLTR